MNADRIVAPRLCTLRTIIGVRSIKNWRIFGAPSHFQQKSVNYFSCAISTVPFENAIICAIFNCCFGQPRKFLRNISWFASLHTFKTFQSGGRLVGYQLFYTFYLLPT